MAEVVSPVPEKEDYGEHLTLVGGVVLFSRVEFLGSKRDDSFFSILDLRQHGSDGARVAGPVGVYDEGLVRVEPGVGQDG